MESVNLKVGRYSAERKQELMKEYEASGLSQVEFCARAGVSPKTFGKWLVRSQRPVGFVEVKMPEGLGKTAELEFPGGVVIRWRF